VTEFAVRARRALADEHVQGMLDIGTGHLMSNRLRAWGELDDVEALRERAREIRARTIAGLDEHLDTFQRALEAQMAPFGRPS